MVRLIDKQVPSNSPTICQNILPGYMRIPDMLVRDAMKHANAVAIPLDVWTQANTALILEFRIKN